MSRNGSGVYTLPAGNPVVDGTTIESTWANPTMADIAVQLNNLITRDGILGPTAPIKFQGGSVGAPGITFFGDFDTGMWSPAADTMAWSAAGVEQMRLASNSLRLGTSSSALDGITLHTSFNIGWDEGSNSALATSFRQEGSGGHIIGSGVRRSANTNAFASSRTTSWGHSAIKVGYEIISFYVNAAASVAVGTDVTMVERMSIDSDGLIFTGTGAQSPYNNVSATAANMVVDSNGYLYRSTSSIKYKGQVRNYTRGIDAVLALRPVFYKSKGSGDVARATEKELAKLPKLPKQYDADGKEIKQKLPKDFVLPAGPDYAGFIAEEVHAAGMTEFVQYADDGTPDALSYGHMTALLCKAIQEQQALIVALTARVAALEK